MSYATIKAEIKTVLEGIAGIKRVYDNPPNSLQDWPSFIFYPAGQRPERRMGGWRVDHYLILARLVAHDADWDHAANTMETIRPLVIEAFEGTITHAGGESILLNGPEAGAGIEFQRGDRMFLGMDFTFDVKDRVTS